MYSTDKTAQGEQIIVNSANTMVPAEDFLQTALGDNPDLAAKFDAVVQLDSNQINGAISQVYSIYITNSSTKYEDIWGQLTTLMGAVSQADVKLAEVRNSTVANVDAATLEAQNYANISLITAVAFLGAASAASVALSVIMGNRITNPLKKLADIAHKVSLGDLNQRYYLKQNIDVKTGDEIDELVNAFRRMVNAFRMTEALSKEGAQPEETNKP
jgi:HAMP domain-containing protein